MDGSPNAGKTLANVLAALVMTALWGASMAIAMQSDLARGVAVPLAVLGSGWLYAVIGLGLVHRLLRRRGWEQVEDLFQDLAMLARQCGGFLVVGGWLLMASVWWSLPKPLALYLNGLVLLAAFLYALVDLARTAKERGLPRYYPTLWAVGMLIGILSAVQQVSR